MNLFKRRKLKKYVNKELFKFMLEQRKIEVKKDIPDRKPIYGNELIIEFNRKAFDEYIREKYEVA